MSPYVPRSPIWHGPSGCTTTVTQLEAVVEVAFELQGDVQRRLTDPGTVFHELIAWAYVYDIDRSRVVLVHHRRFRRWMPPGGRVDAGETPLEAAVRELREETGIGVLVRPGQAAVLVDVVDHPLADGTPAVTFGVAYAFATDTTTVLHSEVDQPAAWWPLLSPPTPVSEHHWARLQNHQPAR